MGNIKNLQGPKPTASIATSSASAPAAAPNAPAADHFAPGAKTPERAASPASSERALAHPNTSVAPPRDPGEQLSRGVFDLMLSFTGGAFAAATRIGALNFSFQATANQALARMAHIGHDELRELTPTERRFLSGLEQGTIKPLDAVRRFPDSITVVRAAVKKDGMALAAASDGLQQMDEIVYLAVEQNGLALQYARMLVGRPQDAAFVARYDALCRLALTPNELALQGLSEAESQARAAQNALAFQYMPAPFRDAKEFAMLAVNQNGLAYKWVEGNARQDRDVVQAAFAQNGLALQFAPDFQADVPLVTIAVTQNGLALRQAPALQNNVQVVTFAVQQNGLALQYAPALQNNDSVALAAVQQDGMALQYVSGQLRAQNAIAIAAIQQNGLAFEYADDVLHGNLAVATMAVDRNGLAYQWIVSPLSGDINLATAAVKNDGMAVQWIDPALFPGDQVKMLAIAAVNQNGQALQHVPYPFQDDIEVVTAAVTKHGQALRWASVRLQKDIPLTRLAAGQDGMAISWARPEPYYDAQGLTVAVQQNGLALQWASEGLRGMNDIVALAVKQNGLALRWASAQLQADPDMVRLAVRQNGLALRWAAAPLRADLSIIPLALAQNGLAVGYVDLALLMRQTPEQKSISEELYNLATAQNSLASDYIAARQGEIPRGSVTDAELGIIRVADNASAFRKLDGTLQKNIFVIKEFFERDKEAAKGHPETAGFMPQLLADDIFALFRDGLLKFDSAHQFIRYDRGESVPLLRLLNTMPARRMLREGWLTEDLAYNFRQDAQGKYSTLERLLTETGQQAIKDGTLFIRQVQDLGGKPNILPAIDLALSENGLAALSNGWISFENMVDHLATYTMALTPGPGLNALRAGTFDDADLAQFDAAALALVLERGMDLIQQGAVTAEQFSRMPKDVVGLLVSPQGRQALQDGVLTGVDAAASSFAWLSFYLASESATMRQQGVFNGQHPQKSNKIDRFLSTRAGQEALRSGLVQAQDIEGLGYRDMETLITGDGIKLLSAQLLQVADFVDMAAETVAALASEAGIDALRRGDFTVDQAKSASPAWLAFYLSPDSQAAREKGFLTLAEWQRTAALREQELTQLNVFLGSAQGQAAIRSGLMTVDDVLKVNVRELASFAQRYDFFAVAFAGEALRIKDTTITFLEIANLPIQIYAPLATPGGLDALQKGILKYGTLKREFAAWIALVTAPESAEAREKGYFAGYDVPSSRVEDFVQTRQGKDALRAGLLSMKEVQALDGRALQQFVARYDAVKLAFAGEAGMRGLMTLTQAVAMRPEIFTLLTSQAGRAMLQSTKLSVASAMRASPQLLEFFVAPESSQAVSDGRLTLYSLVDNPQVDEFITQPEGRAAIRQGLIDVRQIGELDDASIAAWSSLTGFMALNEDVEAARGYATRSDPPDFPTLAALFARNRARDSSFNQPTIAVTAGANVALQTQEIDTALSSTILDGLSNVPQGGIDEFLQSAIRTMTTLARMQQMYCGQSHEGDAAAIDKRMMRILNGAVYLMTFEQLRYRAPQSYVLAELKSFYLKALTRYVDALTEKIVFDQAKREFVQKSYVLKIKRRVVEKSWATRDKLSVGDTVHTQWVDSFFKDGKSTRAGLSVVEQAEKNRRS